MTRNIHNPLRRKNRPSTPAPPAPSPGDMPIRFIEEIGTRAFLQVYWGDRDCPNCGGHGTPGYHNAMVPLVDGTRLYDWKLGGSVEDYADERWPTKCDHCTALVPPTGASRQVHHVRLFNTPIGRPEPCDVYWSAWEHHDGRDGYCDWDNCTGPHLIAVTPNGREWNVDSRASNCTKKDDRTHRCWIRQGDPRDGTIHVDKGGPTCAAGAGSIQVEGYHGFLDHGAFRTRRR